MSGGAWNYNRFDLYEKKADKDYDGDGKVESSKDEYFGSKDKAIKKAMGKGTCKKCEESKEDCGCDDKKEVKENREMAYGGGKPGKGSGDGSKPKGITGGKTYTIKGKDGKPLFKEETLDEKSSCGGGYQMGGTVGYQKGGEVKDKKKKVVKEDVLEYMLENSLANNVVSAEVLFDHISDEFLESIEEEIMEGFKPLPKEKMARQANKAYGQEQQAVRKGDQAGANKQMQRRIAMKDPSSRKQALLNKK